MRISASLKTVRQAFFIWLLSSLPLIWASAWQAWIARDQENAKDFFDYIAQNLGAGEAFLYVSAFVAPFFWVMTSYNDARKKISGFAMWLLLSILAIVASAWLFAASRVAPDGEAAQIPYVGIVLYLLGFAIWVRSLYADIVLALPEVEEPHETTRRSVARIAKGLGDGT
jgi:hypothetical protein